MNDDFARNFVASVLMFGWGICFACTIGLGLQKLAEPEVPAIYAKEREPVPPRIEVVAPVTPTIPRAEQSGAVVVFVRHRIAGSSSLATGGW